MGPYRIKSPRESIDGSQSIACLAAEGFEGPADVHLAAKHGYGQRITVGENPPVHYALANPSNGKEV